MKVLLLILFFFSGCGLYHNSYKPSILFEKKINSSRKAQIIKDNKTVLIATATYLNNVDSSIYNGDREYFLIEVFSELDIPFKEYMHFSLTNNVSFLWIRELQTNEDDEILSSYNKWSKSFLIAFDRLEYQQKKNMKLTLDVDNVGSMTFDFTYEILEMKL
ncbi:hypothetical protein [Helicobacter sp. MIT 14-3879]|uniref:hypothetical protein n=1 Tax=Helicobacter sp. MIT 14-3879 TaxID=2040649 RepID=UPI000E1E7F92|nr:hypothetical protein [Helicobacter sp. MIT 14-3879]RDU62657.1 hypothetical protein CQA44_06630 [Helicobacter sp. MIT 14-3879]